MQDIVKRFTTFDKLIATGLIKILYWIGLVLILFGVLLGIIGAFGTMTQNVMAGLGLLVAAPLGGAIAILFWRFLCEVYIVISSIHDRLGEIRDKS